MTCKHNWNFVDGLTKRIRCIKCAAMNFVNKKDEYVLTDSSYGALKVHEPRPNNILFFNSVGGKQVEVLRISADGVTANPDIPTDEAADAVLRALDGHLKEMVKKARDNCRYEIGVDSANGEHCIVVMRANDDGTTTMVATKTIKENT